MRHQPDTRRITFKPTESKSKFPLQPGQKPKVFYQKYFDWIMFLVKFGAMAAMGTVTYFLITLMSTPLDFLEAAKREKRTEKMVFKHLDSESVDRLISALSQENQMN